MSRCQIVMIGQRRSGTTVSFNLFRRIPGLQCYYEPFHPRLIRHNDWMGLPLLEENRKGVFNEYKDVGGDLPQLYTPMGAPVYPVTEELSAESWSPAHSRYMDFLFASHSHVMLKAVRVNYQLHRIAQDFPEARFVWILRSAEGVISSLMSKERNLFAYRRRMTPVRNLIPVRSDERRKRIKHVIRVKILRLLSRIGLREEPIPDSWSQGEMAEAIVAMRPWYRSLKGAAPWLQLMALWYDIGDAVMAFGKTVGPDRFSIIRYEDLCSDPDSVIGALCGWLGLRSPQSSLRDVISRNPSPPYAPGHSQWMQGHEEIIKLRRRYGIIVDPPKKTLIADQDFFRRGDM